MTNLEELTKEFQNLGNLFIALGHEKRQKIILALLKDDSCEGLRVSDLLTDTNLSRPAISHHMKILKDAQIIDCKKQGTKNYYYLSHNLEKIDKLQSFISNTRLLIESKKK
jgi:Predicted transcriptional regulators